MKIRVKWIKPWRLFHCQFKTQHDLCMTFVRLQEFYESPNPKFRGKFFTFEEYVDWYCQTQGEGDFTYCTDWSGFNVPGNVANRFFNLHLWQDVLRPREEKLYDLIRKRVDMWGDQGEPDDDQYYLIGTTEDSPLSTVQHEIRHAVFYLDKRYRREVSTEIKKCKLKRLYEALNKMGYTKQVHVDEVQAYILTGLAEDMKETKEITKLRKKLRVIEKKYIGDKV